MRRGVFVLFVALAALLAAPATSHAQTGTPVVVLDGKGFGHGVGLAQWGAKYMADAGAGHEDILAKFYPGTNAAWNKVQSTVQSQLGTAMAPSANPSQVLGQIQQIAQTSG